MIETRLIIPGNREVAVGGPELLDIWRSRSDALVWVDISGAVSPEDSELLQSCFGLHQLALQDAARNRHPPKFESFEQHSFLLFKELSADSDSIDCSTIQLAIFVGERFLVTRHSGDSPAINHLAGEVAQARFMHENKAGTLGVHLCRLVVQRYLKVLLALEPRLEELERSVLTTGDDTVLAELIGYKSDLIRLRRFLHYHVDLVAELRPARIPGFGEDLEHEIMDVYDHQERAASLADLYYQQASDLIDGYISISSHRLNQIMRILTIITAIFVPLGFLAGLYGMNFQNMPELHSQWGYYILLSVMGLVATGLLLTFRRKGWL